MPVKTVKKVVRKPATGTATGTGKKQPGRKKSKAGEKAEEKGMKKKLSVVVGKGQKVALRFLGAKSDAYEPYEKHCWEYENAPGIWEGILNGFELEFHFMRYRADPRIHGHNPSIIKIDGVPFTVDFDTFTMKPEADPNFRPVPLRRSPFNHLMDLEDVDYVSDMDSDDEIPSNFAFLKEFRFGDQ
eukprot:TRINITY_DN189_c0_g2_i2.p1 TRINITY_DN189_c0_g2~~TRINITY_DN189_c0_g2_i2.p1  ORF type:complete len:199 (+),score=59.07 TRINITY_DN189_c0_g2_i2:40-597(+)